MIDQIDFFIEVLSTLTKEEADEIEKILLWDQEKKCAFLFAKKIFEENKSRKRKKSDKLNDKQPER